MQKNKKNTTNRRFKVDMMTSVMDF